MNHVLCKSISLRERKNGDTKLVVCKAGYIFNPLYPFLGGSHDGAVYDPSTLNELIWILEIKRPYSQRNVTPTEACESPEFCYCTTIIGVSQVSVNVKNTLISVKCRVKQQLVNDLGVILLCTLPKELKYNKLSLRKFFLIKSYYPSSWNFI